MTMPQHIRVSVGVLAHNEEGLVGPVVAAYITQQTCLAEIVEVVVVSCGSTDGTDLVVRRLAVDEPKLRLVSRPHREGKLDAIRAFADIADGDVLLISGADTVPTSTVVECLVAPFAADPGLGMTGGRVCPAPISGGPAVVLHRALWRLHHEMALRAPKLAEVIAIRSRHLRTQLPCHVHCDEVLLEALVTRDRARLQYIPETRVTNFPPETVAELFRQRRRIACQHLAAWNYLQYRPASSRIRPLGVALGSAVVRRPCDLPVIVALCSFETVARVAGRIDYAKGKRYRTWTLASRANHTTAGSREAT